MEKTLRSLFLHFLHASSGTLPEGFAPQARESQLQSALAAQKARMELATREENERRANALALEKEAAAIEASSKRKGKGVQGAMTGKRKRVRWDDELEEADGADEIDGPPSASAASSSQPPAASQEATTAPKDVSPSSSQQQQLTPEQEGLLSTNIPASIFAEAAFDPEKQNALAMFDVSTLEADLVNQIVCATLASIGEDALREAVNVRILHLARERSRERSDSDHSHQTRIYSF